MLLTQLRFMHRLTFVMQISHSRVPMPDGATQQDVAARVGISQAHLSRVLNGKTVPSLGVALALARELRVPVERFLPGASTVQADRASA